jgi:hypothetical protein
LNHHEILEYVVGDIERMKKNELIWKKLDEFGSRFSSLWVEEEIWWKKDGVEEEIWWKEIWLKFKGIFVLP